MRSWTDEDLIEAVKSSNKLSEVAKKLGLVSYGANTRTIKKHIKRLTINISHFLSKNDQLKEARSSIKSLSNDKIFSINDVDRKHIKKRIIKDNLIPYECRICHLDSWQGQKLSLHLDHINGINNDNRLSNLRFLCPNCHSLTENYCGKQLRGKKFFEGCHCIDCGSDICRDATRCRSCAALCQSTKIIWPNHKELQSMVDELGYRGTGTKLGVTDNSVKKRLINYSN